MEKLRDLLLTIFVILFSITALARTGTGDLTVIITNFHSNDGQVIIDLHNIPDAFPTQREKAYKQIKTQITDNKVTVTFKGIPYGNYAVAVHHDENANDEVDTNFIGIPTEEFGASNNAKGSFGPPDFQDAKININSISKTIKINMD